MLKARVAVLALVSMAMVVGSALGLGRGTASAQTNPPGPIACAVQAGGNNWVNCWATLTNTWPPGTTVSATLNGDFGQTQIVCQNQVYLNCGVNGNTASLICQTGCYPGTQVSLSMLGKFTKAPQPSDFSFSMSSVPPDQAAALVGQKPGTPTVADLVSGTVSCAQQVSAKHTGGLLGILRAAGDSVAHFFSIVWG